MLPDFKTTGIWKWSGCQPYTPATITSQEIFLVCIFVGGWIGAAAIVRLEGLCQWKIPVTPSGIELVKFQYRVRQNEALLWVKKKQLLLCMVTVMAESNNSHFKCSYVSQKSHRTLVILCIIQYYNLCSRSKGKQLAACTLDKKGKTSDIYQICLLQSTFKAFWHPTNICPYC
jgi:hypothetical protein